MSVNISRYICIVCLFGLNFNLQAEVKRPKTDEVKASSIKEPVATRSPADQLIEKRLQHFYNIDELVSLRAPGLAYNYLQREQPEYDASDPLEWLLWEQRRIQLLKYMRKWSDIDQHIMSNIKLYFNHKIATADRNWFLTEQVRAQLELNQDEKALNRLRELMWNASSLVDSKTFAAWRRLVIQVYLQQRLTQDAQIALRRYQQDYGMLQNEDGFSWLSLQAELLIQLEHNSDAIRLLKQFDNPEAQALQLLASYKNKALSAADLLDSASMLLEGSETDTPGRENYQYLQLLAYVELGEQRKSIEWLESFMLLKHRLISPSLIRLAGLKPDANMLWQQYLGFGESVANKKGLLKGNDDAWYLLANKLAKKQPVVARSLLAVLALEAKEKHQRQLSMKQMVALLEVRQASLFIINQLFNAPKYVPSVEAMPAEVRYSLIDYNLSQGGIGAAARLMSDLQQPPKDQPQFEWNLRRARVLILSGSFSEGARLLLDMLETPLENNQADKYLQVVFDLQAVEQFQISLTIFNRLKQLVEDPVLQRELTFWQAESYAGLKQYDQAAYLFLRSAQSPEKVYDPWYHTSMFRAAESLMSAKLYDDARERFMHLLNITGNAARKAVIRQRLQALQLKSQL